ncbi:hypothetical protein GKT29_25775 [Salmonella enterica]|nr:hypothetical protein [Salmonella enterica]
MNHANIGDQISEGNDFGVGIYIVANSKKFPIEPFIRNNRLYGKITRLYHILFFLYCLTLKKTILRASYVVNSDMVILNIINIVIARKVVTAPKKVRCLAINLSM